MQRQSLPINALDAEAARRPASPRTIFARLRPSPSPAFICQVTPSIAVKRKPSADRRTQFQRLACQRRYNSGSERSVYSVCDVCDDLPSNAIKRRSDRARRLSGDDVTIIPPCRMVPRPPPVGAARVGQRMPNTANNLLPQARYFHLIEPIDDPTYCNRLAISDTLRFGGSGAHLVCLPRSRNSAGNWRGS